MTTIATAIRDAIYSRLATLPGYATMRKTPVPQIQPDDLPSLAVYISAENLSADGDDNAGEPDFVSDVTIAIAVVRGFDDPAVLSGAIDADVDAIETRLLTDPTFVTFGPKALFEGVTSIKRRRLYPQNGKDGETYFSELRLEITFRTRVSFPPNVTDDYRGVTITARPQKPGKPANDPSVTPAIFSADPQNQ